MFFLGPWQVALRDEQGCAEGHRGARLGCRGGSGRGSPVAWAASISLLHACRPLPHLMCRKKPDTMILTRKLDLCLAVRPAAGASCGRDPPRRKCHPALSSRCLIFFCAFETLSTVAWDRVARVSWNRGKNRDLGGEVLIAGSDPRQLIAWGHGLARRVGSARAAGRRSTATNVVKARLTCGCGWARLGTYDRAWECEAGRVGLRARPGAQDQAASIPAGNPRRRWPPAPRGVARQPF